MKAKNEPSQWYRLVFSIFLHGGVLHYALNMYFQMTLGVQVERASGWLRMMLIYMIVGADNSLRRKRVDAATIMLHDCGRRCLCSTHFTIYLFLANCAVQTRLLVFFCSRDFACVNMCELV
jgi:membrane associated rhomboid family serine protease